VVALSSVLDWVVALMRTIGAPGVGVATLLETVFPPVPSEVVLPLAGYTASQGHYGLAAAIAWATAGSVVGALLLYWAGAVWGVDRLYRLAERLPLLHREDVERSVAWFGRNGRSAVFVGRLVPGVRSLVSIPAGVDRMPLGRFTAYTAAGSLLWNTLLIGAGYELGAQWHLIEGFVDRVSAAVCVLLGLGIVALLVRRVRHRRRQRGAGTASRGSAGTPKKLSQKDGLSRSRDG
jgi:membrane protein DedA with SNARE-associated domain